MGNLDCCMSEEHLPVTNERLEWAVRKMDPKEVQACLEAGLDVNMPIDRQGHTIMDIFVVEHQHMLKKCQTNRGRPEDQTRLFCEMQESAAQVLRQLRGAGAVMSAQSAALRRGV
mmetsp:Transcript_17761/g.44334  ORF Transcript_17761/g.44334 Transcript_17761/m.44334 type:complete len:115 (+) Transcript_17761:123-467(+)